MKRIFAIVALLLPLMLTAQGQRLWADGPLTWNDFRTVTADGNSSYLCYRFGYSQVTGRTAEGNKIDYYRAEAYMVPAESWVDARYRTDLLLRYNQLVFDLLEVERRQLSRTVITCNTQSSLDAALASANTTMTNTLLSLRVATADGTDSNAIALWEQSTRRRLDTLPAEVQPAYEQMPISAAFALGYGASVPLGGTDDYFTSGSGMYFTTDVGYKRHILDLNYTLTDAKLCVAIVYTDAQHTSHIVNQHEAANLISGTLCYGYRMVERPCCNLTPLVGWSWGTRFVSDGQQRASLNCNGVALGLNYRYHFSRRYRMSGLIASNGDVPELTLWSVDARMIATRSVYDNSDASSNGWTLLFGIGVSMGGHQARVAVKQ